MARTRLLAAFCATMAIALAGCATPTTTPTPTPMAARETATTEALPTATIARPTVTPAPPTVTFAPAPTVLPTKSPTAARTPAGSPSPTPRSVPSPAVPGNARAWDWATVVAADPALDHPDVPRFEGIELGPYVEARDASGRVMAQGYAMTGGADMAFADLDSDGGEEAAVQLFSGGTAGNTGLLVYKISGGLPRLVDVMGGYKLWARADGRELLVTEPIYAGWEPNCCPSGFSETHYRLDSGRLAQTRRVEGGHEEAGPLTVEEFYARLGRKEYEAAYAFLSPDFRAAHPYAAWKAGYATTVAVEVTASALPDGRVGVELTAVDQTEAGRVTRRYKGTWSLVWNPMDSQWLLDSADIALAR